jgi:hypothetical protein
MEAIVNGSLAESFTYKPLEDSNAFRLLILHPGSNGQPIRCSLDHDSASDSAPYEALSYVWGDPSVQQTIFVEGKELYVTTNLASALAHLRYSHRQRVL